MLRFRLGSIPVEVRPSHLAIAALLAWSWMPGAQSGGSAVLPAILLGALVVFVSILVHELGHAVLARLFGYRPEIVIEWFGGHTTPNAPGPIPWWKDVVLTFAGPLFGLFLALVAFVAMQFTGAFDGMPAPLWKQALDLLVTGGPGVELPLAQQALGFFFRANVAWAVLNLVPVLPLDGGRISNAIFTRVLGQKGVLASQGVSLVISIAAVTWAITRKPPQPLIAIFFGMWGFSALRIVSAYLKGSAPPMMGPHPADLAFAQAAALFGERKYAEARDVALKLLENSEPLPAPTRARLHHLLGWIAIKEGEGRLALDHFSQMDRSEVEPQALAAAFALVGDDDRARTLWELAFRTTNDPTVRAEWAGTLIRLGRMDDARKVAEGELREAYRAAETTLIARRDFDGAARIGLQALEEVPSAELAYDTACSLAKGGRPNEAQALLERAYELGFRNAGHAEQDPDLAALRQTPEFIAWLTRVRQSPQR